MATARTPPAAAVLLSAAVIIAPLLAGGWKLSVLPLIAAPVIAAWGVLLAQRLRSGRRLSVPLLSLALFVLALFTALQNALLGGLLELLSPRTAEVRDFVAEGHPRAISYELGATWREAAKLTL